MISKATYKPRQNLWGDDHPEKVKKSSTRKVGFKQGLKGLFSPEAFKNQIFGRRKETPYPQKERKRAPRRRETLLFSFEQRREEKSIQEETKLILEQLKEQIALLEKSEKSLVQEVSKIKVEQLPKKSSLYYLRFLEWLLMIVRKLRMKVEDGRAWLKTFTSRKKKKLGYWQMYKKHGTTFGLSHERSLATQIG